VRPSEEQDLLLRFGDAYRRYRDRVPLWLPWPRPRGPRPAPAPE
jgi:protein-S-isoprenylcysteine O-methyltransferase Ste14